jgi:hypothetical protein
MTLLSQAKKALYFYEQLLSHLKNLDKKVELWVQGRKEASLAIAAEIEALEKEKGGGDKGKLDKGKKEKEFEKFYDEALGQFAKGGSVFLPKNNMNQSVVISHLGEPKE